MSKDTTKKAVATDGAGTTAHFILQGKGGVGKSLVASILAQYFTDAGRDVKCYDTDPVNSTLARYEALGAEHLPLLVDGRVDARKFDTLMEDILSSPGRTFVVDNGASTFLPLGYYMAENQAYEMMSGSGIDVVTHCVVTGGQALKDTLFGLDALAKIAGPRGIVVWVNEYFGPVEYDGVPFTELPVFTTHKAKIRGVITLQRRNPDTFGADVSEMVSKHRTFKEAVAASDVPIMAKSRLNLVRKEAFDQLAAVGVK